MHLFETFGGWCDAVKRLFYQMKDKVRNKLSKRQHEDEASWSTRSWLSLQAQRMSVALQLARGGGRDCDRAEARRGVGGRRSRLDSPASLRASPSL